MVVDNSTIPAWLVIELAFLVPVGGLLAWVLSLVRRLSTAEHMVQYLKEQRAEDRSSQDARLSALEDATGETLRQLTTKIDGLARDLNQLIGEVRGRKAVT